ncbi:hypothetical protein OOT00_01875 [Desulfobotulus sp. H1]|uniref:Uncharacterized protein n=1 Tax=Desulfobotulus pelophilus TaxID=2823377 RepID=A0ABT3N6R6_9BACT|nr:hypothetical protein [Desulfobotulus pelophilus]MCW7752732.1 hypothetical protein [Desulfobotulus pelophilus]
MFDCRDEGQWMDSLDAHGLPEAYHKICGKLAAPLYVGVTAAEALKNMLLKFPEAATFQKTENFMEAFCKSVLVRLREGLPMEIISEAWGGDVDALRGAALDVLGAIEKKTLRREKCTLPTGHKAGKHHISVAIKGRKERFLCV